MTTPDFMRRDARVILGGPGAEAVVYAPRGGKAASVPAILNREPDMASAPSGVGNEFGYAQALWALVLMHAEDIPAPQRDADTLTDKSGAVWTVRRSGPAMCGAMWRLWCSRGERGGHR